jgi:hypothetical protein
VSGFFLGCQIACLILLALVVAFWIAINTPKAKFATEPLSLVEFYKRSGHLSGLPSAATGVFYVGSRTGPSSFRDLYRLDAPAADCISYGKNLLHENRPSKPADLVPLRASPDLRADIPSGATSLARAVDWFEIESVRSGFVGHLEWPDRPTATFWIDTERGRFYYFSSD